MNKKVISLILCICIIIVDFPVQAIVFDSDNMDKRSQFTVGEIGGYLAGNAQALSKIITEEKFNFASGHGFAAERGNDLIDKLTNIGSYSKVVGDNNAKNGADRLIIRNGSTINIQDKYYSSASRSVGAAFERDPSTGEMIYRYMNADGTPMILEVPADQYEKSIELMKTRIKKGEVPGVSDPDEAVNIVKKGNLTFKQARNLAKAGTLESLTYDAAYGVVYGTGAAGISFLIDYACCRINGNDIQTSLKESGLTALKTGSVVFCTTVISSQLLKTGINKAFLPVTEKIATHLGKDVCEAILVCAGQSAGKEVVKQASKILANNIITSGVMVVVLTAPDVIELFRGRISQEELLKNLCITIVGVAAGAAGAVGGAALGSLIAPGAGTVIGGVAGGVAGGTLSTLAAEAIIAPYYESDSEKMFSIISNEFLSLAEDYMIDQNEGDKITKKLQEKLSGEVLKEMFASEDRVAFARELMEPLFENQIKLRDPIEIPTEAEIRAEMKETLQGIVFVH